MCEHLYVVSSVPHFLYNFLLMYSHLCTWVNCSYTICHHYNVNKLAD